MKLVLLHNHIVGVYGGLVDLSLWGHFLLRELMLSGRGSKSVPRTKNTIYGIVPQTCCVVDAFGVLDLTASNLDLFLTPFDLNRLKKYTENLVDYHMIIDLIPSLARLYFLGHLNMSLNESKSVCG